MASRWYWRVGELEMGPVSFAELTAMVRDCVINELDLVRPDYLKEWQKAYRVVGLFHMAQRTPVIQPEAVLETGDDGTLAIAVEMIDDPYGIEDESCESELSDPSDVTGDSTQSKTHQSETQLGSAGSSLRRLGTKSWEEVSASLPPEFVDILHSAPDLEGSTSDESNGEFVPSGTGNWADVVQSAVDHLDAREESRLHPGGRLGKLTRLGGSLFSTDVLRQIYRAGFTLLCLWAFSYWLMNWSAEESLRFPAKKMGGSLRFFPVIGACYIEDFWLMFALSAILIGAAAYVAAAKFESQFVHTD